MVSKAMDKNRVQDTLYMKRCLELAKLAKGSVAPNPLVGAVVVYKDIIIGEGFHKQYGEPHAEVNAIESVKDKSLLKESTLYVNLEPCCHYGKTPPCTSKILDVGIPHVVIAALDPFEKVSGTGAKILKQAGVKVEIGLLENEARYLNRFFYTFHEKKRPFVFFKWAQTIDGYIDRVRSTNEKPSTITDNAVGVFVHRARAASQAIMVGTNTVINDNPSLTTRLWKGKNPIRVTLDRYGKLDSELSIFNGESPCILFSSEHNTKNYGGNTEVIRVNFNESLEESILYELYQKGIQSLMVEGGSSLINSFIQTNLWDEAFVLINNIFTLGKGVKAPTMEIEATSSEQFQNGNITLLHYLTSI